MKERKIKYKEVSEAMKKACVPASEDKISRISIGMDNHIGEYHFLNVDKLEPYKYQTRKLFSEEALSELTESIKANGVKATINSQA